MTLVICLALLVPLGILVPRLIVPRMPTGLGIVLGAAAALGLGFLVVLGVAEAVAALTGRDSKLEFESGFNAWKLLVFLAPAAGLHFRRRAAQGGGG
jgi:hypothetical protein